MRTPDYVIRSDMEYDCGQYDRRRLEARTFVRPVEFQYVPEHVKEKPRRLYKPGYDSLYERNRGYDKSIDVFCYCHYGFVLVERSEITSV